MFLCSLIFLDLHRPHVCCAEATFHIPQGNLVVLSGNRGSGKKTVLELMAGDAGHVPQCHGIIKDCTKPFISVCHFEPMEWKMPFMCSETNALTRSML